ncbi:MAG: M1 family metallopeptidase [Saprospiraceae bacterium]|nr:M1 family metallopeptidase [Saprospiraceae bacterium]
MRIIISCLMLLFFSFVQLNAQSDRWQQRINYQMDIDFDVEKHQYQGTQRVIYFNNSPDALDQVFYHLFFNAFQPGSMMDVRSNTISDPDRRVGNRISKLKPDEIGYQKIKSLKHNGQDVDFEVVGTILEVHLKEPIAPNSSAVFDMEFEAQVPLQIRRSGRDNAEGISYSMSQWYPKMAEYDYQGWHANPYVGREFYGVWGDFDVNITIDKAYTIGGTGYLQNPDEIGHGYTEKEVKVKGDKLEWNFFAPNVHDFMWAADPDYTHDTFKRKDGLVLHFYYQKNERTEENWAQLPEIMDCAFDFINENFGQYPYQQYSFIQGGDGGMEYPMGTLITGERTLGSLVGVSVHELMHSWYQMVLGTNESLYPWMDEGFTSYASALVMNHLRKEGKIPGSPSENVFGRTYMGFANFAKSGMEEPLIIHADHFTSNAAYGVGSYTKGSIFLHQLSYIIGEEAFKKGMLAYYDEWKFKHPNSNDFIRVMEKQSGLELDWYREYWVNTTHTIDYGIKSVEELDGKKTKVTLSKIGVMPMPLDIAVETKSGETKHYNIALRIMRGNKADAGTILEDWPWTHPEYEMELDVPKSNIQKIIIDPEMKMLDVERENNEWAEN